MVLNAHWRKHTFVHDIWDKIKKIIFSNTEKTFKQRTLDHIEKENDFRVTFAQKYKEKRSLENSNTTIHVINSVWREIDIISNIIDVVVENWSCPKPVITLRNNTRLFTEK